VFDSSASCFTNVSITIGTMVFVLNQMFSNSG
jgi:hypothetical protein